MKLQRHPNKIVEREGVNFIRSLVESTNSIFTEIDLGNDLGIDCYIDFTINNFATGFTICAQIKSGKSFKDKKGYKIVSDKAHSDRWINHTLQVAGLVYDPEKKCAFWISISDYLRDNPELQKKDNHTIRVSERNILNQETFIDFKDYFLARITQYRSLENLGRSLDEFANFLLPYRCYNGLKSLFSNHRERESAWTYIITSFEHIVDAKVQANILGMLSNFVNNGDIYWNPNKPEYAHFQTSPVRVHVLKTIEHHFSPGSVKQAVLFLNDGIVRHSFSYLVFLVLDQVGGIDNIIYNLASDSCTSLDKRQHLFWLYAHFAQYRSKELAIKRIRDFISEFPDDDGVLLGTLQTIEQEGHIQTG